ncbi:glutamate ABC transporter substrate-binding protein [Allokutzneria sp. A3M-2-11 16]|uniref:glutamate ABC transporter substrate-binding protein n=1 Tax=Allokutzneria sp. A3M-2-11 16 TaxID=2962043 RepID=UPI0020B870BE|nr:glutamate ABC transporter substrate-binding protein [Allokutzneria sp. A3M-2-11 16]MCP3799620.1 glutamate ABC transporter substrate-binding protein [Allokutzneria sp. A3M-2-11 16]
MRQFRALSVAVTMLAVAGCGMFGSSAPAEDPPPADGPKLTVGIKFDQPGVGLRTPSGTFEGLDVEVARYLARELGVHPGNITFVEARSGDREAMLEQGKVDLIAASYSITDARKQKVDFAGPYFVAGQSLLVRRANSDITGPESLDYSDWKLCSVTGSTPAQKVKESYARSVTLQEFSSYSECVSALERGDIDALTTDDVILAGYAAQQPDKFKLVGKPFSTERYGVGVRKGDERLQKITAALRKMISDGSWNRIVSDSVGKSGYKIPEPPQVAEKP